MHCVNRQNGFTLWDLLLALAVVGILTSASLNAFSDWIPRQRAYSAINTFRTLFQFARTTAVYSQRPVTVCALTPQQKCTRDWGNHRDIAVFHDNNENRHLDDEDDPLRRISWPTRLGVISWRASLARNFIDFLPEGNTWQNGTLYYCPANGDVRLAYALVLSHSGRSYAPGDSDGDGVREDRQGKALEC